jgi:RNA polymerase sigma factor (sigma-70 family)
VSTCVRPPASTLSGDRRSRELDEPTIREFLRTDYPRLVAAVGLACGSRAAGEDAVCEALARAWERTERGEEIRNLRAWVATVALNYARSGFRRILVERRARERLAPVPDIPGADEDAIDLRRALGTLPRKQREASVLRYYLGLNVAEVAEVMGISEGTAKTSLYRARQKLAAELGEREPENDVV